MRSEPVGEPVQLTVGQGDAVVHKRKVVGRAARLLLEELVQAKVRRVLHAGMPPQTPDTPTSTVGPDDLRIAINLSLLFLHYQHVAKTAWGATERRSRR